MVSYCIFLKKKLANASPTAKNDPTIHKIYRSENQGSKSPKFSKKGPTSLLFDRTSLWDCEKGPAFKTHLPPCPPCCEEFKHKSLHDIIQAPKWRILSRSLRASFIFFFQQHAGSVAKLQPCGSNKGGPFSYRQRDPSSKLCSGIKSALGIHVGSGPGCEICR